MMAGRELTKLKQKYPDLEVEEIDVVSHPATAWNDNIRMIPALKSGDSVLSGIFLSGERIKNFIKEL
jgi:hypothetical protein